VATILTLCSIIGGVIIGAAFVPPAAPAAASHYRSTQLTWTKVGPTTVRFHSTLSHRRSWYGTPGSNLGDKHTFYVATGNTYNYATIEHTVVAVDEANDWLLMEGEGTYQYPGVGPYTASLEECCRLGGTDGHINNDSDDNRIETLVNLAATSASPSSAISPIVDCPKNGRCTFSIPATRPEGDGLRFRFSSTFEATGNQESEYGLFNQPGPPFAPQAATIDPTSGLYSWDTTGAKLADPGKDTYYSTQVTIENLSRGQVVSKTAVDFFIRIADTSANRPPAFACPTPADGTTIAVGVGKPVAFDLAATDPDPGNTVRIGLLNKPASASFALAAGNPASASFSWTPTVAGTTLLTLTAQDQRGLGATQRSVTIVATAGGPEQASYTLALSAVGNGTAVAEPAKSSYRAGECVAVRAVPYGDAVFTGWTVDGEAAGHANPLALTIDRNRAVVAFFNTPPTFCDVRAGDLYYDAIRQLAARGIIRGFDPGDGSLCFGPDQDTRRAQMAALIARPLGWDGEDAPNAFTDRCLNGDPNNCVDDALWRNVGSLAVHNVARGYKAETCAASRLANPCYGPHDQVLNAQVISFVTRGMVEKGYWQFQPDNPALYPNVAPDSGHRIDIATYLHYVSGPIPGTGSTTEVWNAASAPSNRAWFAEVLWRALDSYFGLDRTQ
jgi:hypothetical protein